MRSTAVVIIFIFTQCVQGYASHYSLDRMERVIGDRIAPGRTWKDLELPLPITDGYIAAPLCEDIGEVWYLRPAFQEQWESFLVVDCAGPDAIDWMEDNDILVEVDYKTAERWGTIDQWLYVERRVRGSRQQVVEGWEVPIPISQPMYRRYK